MDDAQTQRRYELRYRFAKLLTAEKFDKALDEAIVAYSRGEILKADLGFVVQISRTAERMGQTKLSNVAIAQGFLQQEIKSEPSVAADVTKSQKIGQ